MVTELQTTESRWAAVPALRRRAIFAATRIDPRPFRVYSPTFILGCGRSGTTILGRLLEQHHLVAYLNEPRRIWELDPATDIWSSRAEDRQGRLRLTDKDVNPKAASRIRRRFAAEVQIRKRTRLVEKLPINCFRVEYVDHTCPGGRFIHIVRDGKDVAASIQVAASGGPWFGHHDYKWRLLARYADREGLGDLVPLCTTDFLKGLLEWRLAVQTARASLATLPPARWTELRYEDLVGHPAETCGALERFLDLGADPGMRSFAASSIGPVKHPERAEVWDDNADSIAGPLLRSLGYSGEC